MKKSKFSIKYYSFFLEKFINTGENSKINYYLK